MKYRSRRLRLSLLATVCTLSALATAQQGVIAAETTDSAVPRVVNYSGTLADLSGRPLTGVTGVTFFLYKDAQGGAPLWMETQNLQPDKTGHYTVTLGSTTNQGLPADVFVSGEARWLGVQVHGQEEQPRVLLVAVPYALKAHDAETIGGLPASAFVLAAPTAGGAAVSNSCRNQHDGAGRRGYDYRHGHGRLLPDFTGAATIGNSAVFQSGVSPTAKIGVNTTTPSTASGRRWCATIRGLLTLPATGGQPRRREQVAGRGCESVDLQQHHRHRGDADFSVTSRTRQ